MPPAVAGGTAAGAVLPTVVVLAAVRASFCGKLGAATTDVVAAGMRGCGLVLLATVPCGSGGAWVRGLGRPVGFVVCDGWMEGGRCVRGGRLGLGSVNDVVGSPGVDDGVAAGWVVLMELCLHVVAAAVRV